MGNSLPQKADGVQRTISCLCYSSLYTNGTKNKMKTLILLAIVIASLFAAVHGSCSITELSECISTKMDCEHLVKSIDCYKGCGVDIPDTVNNALKEAGCGASAITNLGLPMMLLIAVVAFFNKQ